MEKSRPVAIVTTIERTKTYELASFSRFSGTTSKVRTNTIFTDRERLKPKGYYFYYKEKSYISFPYLAKA